MFSFLAFNLEEEESILDVIGMFIASLIWPLVIIIAVYEVSKK